MKAKVTLSASAGVMLEYDGVKILSDFLHNDNVPVFSSVPLDICREIIEGDGFSGAELFLISHDHPDHFSKPLANEYLVRNKNTLAVAPFRFTERQVVFSGASGKLKSYNAKVDYIKTPHEKQKVYAGVKHYSYIVTIGSAKFAFFNDMSIEPEYIEQLTGVSEIDLAFINFPWITLKHGRKYLSEYLNAKNAVIYHLPVPSEDEYGYNAAAKKSLSHAELGGINAVMLNTPLQCAEFDI